MNQEKVKTFENIIKKNYPNICGVVVMKDNKIVYENYENKDMLTMTAPLKYKEPPYVDYFTGSDYLKFSLDMLGGDNEIGTFSYAPLIGPDVLSGIIKNSTNQSVLEFATKNLFEPLGILPPENIVFKNADEQFLFNQSTDKNNWVADSKNLNTAGWGLALSTLDMAKIGQLYLNGGVYNCKRIVSTNWVKESTSVHSHLNELMYGYLWWILDEYSFAALGDGGNTIYVDTKNNIIVSISALFVPNSKEKIKLIKQYIKPAFED
ncbi:serine hydrolase domain-containing protein [Intestinibacter sp.]|uniref:serine hydrolase domain-containing protein n=1 Tax=Intestinibacter sp. TaxID=1965304 RepID=UPI002A910FCF|nr:serine hydrolase [Intestinibacter sp.]MDY5212638.1 serine hydrolase [Intestinibacter sp.]